MHPFKHHVLVCKMKKQEGRLIVKDFVTDEDKTSPRFAAIFALNMLANTKEGNSYSAVEYDRWLKEAGFLKTERIILPGPTDLMVAWKAGRA